MNYNVEKILKIINYFTIIILKKKNLLCNSTKLLIICCRVLKHLGSFKYYVNTEGSVLLIFNDKGPEGVGNYVANIYLLFLNRLKYIYTDVYVTIGRRG